MLFRCSSFCDARPCLSFIFSRFLISSSSRPSYSASNSSALFPGLVSSTSDRTLACLLEFNSSLDFIFSRFFSSSPSRPSYVASNSSALFPGLISSTMEEMLSRWLDFISCFDFIFVRFLSSSSSRPSYVDSNSSAVFPGAVSSTRFRIDALFKSSCEALICPVCIFFRFLINSSSLPSYAAESSSALFPGLVAATNETISAFWSCFDSIFFRWLSNSSSRPA